jgi:hypothetical protein
MKPLHIHTRAQNHPDKQKSRYMSRIGGCSPALAAINVYGGGGGGGGTRITQRSGLLITFLITIL